PVAQSQRVVLAQTLHIARFETDLFGVTQCRVDWHKRAIRKDIPADEIRTLRHWIDRTICDPMVKEDSTRPQQVPSVLEIKRELAFADVLKHTDTDNFLKTACPIQVAVIASLRSALFFQASPLNALISQCRL